MEDDQQKKERLETARGDGGGNDLTKKALKASVGSMATKARLAMSFGEKVSEHWPILIAAIFFDFLAMIPFLSVVVNFAFAGLLFLYFGSKKKTSGSELKNIVLPVFLGSIGDMFLSILPVNFAAALYRIWVS